MDGAARKASGARALGSAEFAVILKSPKRARSRHFTLSWRHADRPALGTVVSKKLAGGAIRRNLVKRHAREAFRASVAGAGAADGGLQVVIRVAADIRALPRQAQYAEIVALFAACGRQAQHCGRRPAGNQQRESQ